MKETIQLTANEVLKAVALWVQRNRPDLSDRYEHIRGNVPGLTFELYDEKVPKARSNGEDNRKPVEPEDNKDNKDKEHKRLIRIDDSDAKAE